MDDTLETRFLQMSLVWTLDISTSGDRRGGQQEIIRLYHGRLRNERKSFIIADLDIGLYRYNFTMANSDIGSFRCNSKWPILI